MSQADRDRWNASWESRRSPGEPSPWVRAVVDRWFPRRGRALDLAGGAGRHALVLAEHGLDTTLSDISDVGASIAAGLHARIRVDIRDLDDAAPPDGPWDAILVFHYLNRSVLARLPAFLAPGGIVALCIATVRNLERHAHPSARFLLQPQELRRYVEGLEVLLHEEAWTEEGRHEARIVARNPLDLVVQ